jgi:hypothetical protein
VPGLVNLVSSSNLLTVLTTIILINLFDFTFYLLLNFKVAYPAPRAGPKGLGAATYARFSL